ncbi:SusC/RagA family TonB-linked outer membrane protein [Winogradskyella sp. F6397]|uniref:SusC/RagA family TonB-linked outer membrane protein n=3 Tax=Winogradskyella TaxID=286104 RepID=A0ABS0EEK8_9FLAO|nr:SusC/RagA family TonB-linked outer membrane protein [Winogradskyella marina]
MTNLFVCHKRRFLTVMMKTFIFLFCTTVFSLSPKLGFSQDVDIVIDSDQSLSIEKIFSLINKQTDLKFVYRNDLIKNVPQVPLEKGIIKVSILLEKSLTPGNLTFEFSKSTVIVKKREKSSSNLRQAVTVTGKVVDENGVPMMGVTILVKNKNIGTSTDFNGEYSIKANSNDALVFSSIGFFTQTIEVKDQHNIDVILVEDVASLSEVIITGYNTIVEKKNTGAISTVKTKDIPAWNPQIDNMIQGQIAGVAVAKTSGEVGSVPIVKIRGTSTLTGNTSPLWVVDGVVLEDPVPLTPAELNTPDLVNRIGNSMSGINPQDIESITVLKDASASAIYGVRAAGGVIVLKTKRGIEGKPVININIGTSVTQRPRYSDFNLMNSKERIGIEQYYFDSGLQYYNADANINSVGLAGAYARYKNRDLQNWQQFEDEVRLAQTSNTDWFKELFRDAVSLSTDFNISGGGKNVNYYASLSYLNQEGTDVLTTNRRYNGSVKLNAKLSEKLNVELYLSTFNTNRSSYPYSYVPAGISNFTRVTPTPFNYAINTSRTFPLYNNDGSYNMYRGHSDFYLFNIMNEYDNSNQETKTNSNTTRLSINYDALDNLKFFGVFNFTNSNQLNETYYTEETNQVAGIRRSNYGEPAPEDSNLPRGGVIFSNSNFQEYYMTRMAVEYTPVETDVNYFKFYAGGEYRVNNYRGDNTVGWGYLHDRGRVIATSENIGEELAGSPYLKIRDYTTKSASYFGVLTYSLYDKYVINGNVRFDGSNLFGSSPEYRWEPAWSVSGRWNVMEENFLKESVFDNLSIRASYGLQGSTNSQNTPQIVASFLNPAYWSDLDLLTIASPANPNLRWEKTYSTNIGLDFAILNNRIQGAIDVYDRYSKDLITNTRISEVNGFSSLPINFADVSNKGVEFGLTTRNIRNAKPGFNWSTTVNFAYNKNEVKKVNIDPNVSRMLSPFPYKPDAAIVGKPLNALYSVSYSHLDENGIAHFNLANGETTTSSRDLEFGMEDLVYNGPIEAPYQGGISNLFEFRNFRLSALMTYGFGNYFRKEEILTSWMYSPDQNLNRELLNAWREPGDENFTDIPHIQNETGANNHKYYWNKSDIRVIKGDYLRLSNVTLQYNLPENMLKSLKLTRGYIQIEGNNLLLFADEGLDGYDPETFPYKSLPIPTSFLMSFNVTF